MRDTEYAKELGIAKLDLKNGDELRIIMQESKNCL